MIRALIVDDDVPTRVGVRTILSSEPDIEVVGEAATGGEALELAAQLEPDVVLMDVRLPDIDGLTVTRQITSGVETDSASESSTDTPRPKVIVLTTFDFDEYVYRSIRAGRPRRSSIRVASGLRYSAHGLGRGNRARSSTTTSKPRSASRAAVVLPAGPAPMIATSCMQVAYVPLSRKGEGTGVRFDTLRPSSSA